MKQLRLLPVVIFAGLALLALKGAGLLFDGGYVLTGVTAVQAAGGGEHGAAAAEPAEGAPAEGDATLTLPEEPTIADTSPTLADEAPTLPLGGEESSSGHGESAVAAADAEHGAAAEGEAEAGHGEAVEVAEAVEGAVAPDCPVVPAEGGVPSVEGADPACAVEPAAAADSPLVIKDAAGNVISDAEGGATSESEPAVLERLGERRTTLDTREAELDLRMALVEAAEKRLEERTAALEALEARINAMVDEKRTLEEQQLVAVVAMYETMKPKDAAAIFDQLDLDVLLRVARGMSPRKLAPVMAKMDEIRAKELTTALAVDQVEPTIDLTGQDLSALPQIVGQ